MATVQRSNVILQVSDEPDIIERYKAKGFDVIDSVSGEIIDKAIPQDTESLRTRVFELEKELSEKETEIQSLKKKLAAKKSKKVD